MKRVFFICLVIVLSINAFSQDKLVLKSGEELNVKVVANNENTIQFTYPGETLVNEKNKREISCIIYESGRKEEFHVGIDVPVINSEKDWEKVVETQLESDVAGLTRVAELKATSGWGGSLGSSIGDKGAIKKLKKKAAKLGAGVILVHGSTNGAAAALGGGVQVTATAYK